VSRDYAEPRGIENDPRHEVTAITPRVFDYPWSVTRPKTPKVPALVTLDPSEALSTEAPASRLKALYDVGRLLLEQTDPARVLESIHATVVAHLGPEHACVLRVAADGSLQPLATTCLDLDGPMEGWPVSQTVLRKVRDSGLAVLATDVGQDPDLDGAGSIHRLRVRSVLCVPLGRAPVRGLVYLDSREEHGRTFDQDDLEFLTALSVHASLILDRAYAHHRATEDLNRSRERLELLEEELLRHEIVGRSPKLLAAYDALRRFAAAGARVLLRGETGTGKELFARAYASASPRRGRAYVPVPIPALAPTVVESELFGHVRGAFTEAGRDKKGRLELAHGGVLFLDEVGDVDLPLQPKLLRFLDSGELYRVGDTQPRHVDALVVSATNRPVEKLVGEGRFRDDLLARLGHTIQIPPLRERPDDVPRLVEHFLGRHERDGRRHSFAADAMDALQSYRWEFNVRQLQQVVEHVVCLVDRDVVRADDLPPFLRTSRGAGPAAGGDPDRVRPLREVVQEVEKAHIIRILDHTKGNRRQAIELLGVSPETFYKRLEEFGLHKKSE
jgi:transcriptional regulator with GAF, ATPase, and Fis domain